MDEKKKLIPKFDDPSAKDPWNKRRSFEENIQRSE